MTDWACSRLRLGMRKGWTRPSAFKRCSIVPSRGATENKGGGWDIDPKVEYGEELEALSARPVLPANQVASPGAAQEALPLAPAPAEVAPDQEERAALREEVKTLIVQQLQEEELRMEGVRLSVHFPEMREVYSSTAENIMSYDLEISKETNAESLREWRDKIDQAPNLLKPLIKDYLPKRKRR
ncbi:hypothetical protein ACOSQ2_003275 [Xanthoceras sorbifolium]